ncbi:MAG: hypothetical protein HYV45_01215 [Candidatus Moranbacteria bacterium]|nr:hypothetical protein [Candidatus Moranbacteria bacterium]
MSKNKRVLFAILWGIITVISGFLILTLVGLHDAFSGSRSLVNPPFISLVGLFTASLISLLGMTWASRGEDSPTKNRVALICTILPPTGIVLLIVSILFFTGN